MVREIAIAAYYETEFKRRSGRHVLDWAAEAATGALAAAGLRKDDVDGLITNAAMSGACDPFWSARVSDFLSMTPRWLESVDLGGGSALGAVARAAAAIRSGFVHTVVCVLADAPSSAWRARWEGYRPEFEDPYGAPGMPGLFGLIVRRYTEQYGDPSEALRKIAMTQRRHAQLNPNALLRGDMTPETYFGSKPIVDKLRMLDSVMYCDGGLAVVVTGAERARSMTDKPVYLTGYSEIHNFDGSNPQPDVTVSGFTVAGPEALAQAGMRIDQVDQIQPYDDFTIAVLIQLEDLGFCGKGEGSDFVLRTDLSYQGDLPLNTGGGQISAGQPGLAGGMVQLVEAIRQLRGEGGERQIPAPKNALVTGIGVVSYIRNWNTSAVGVFEV